MPEAYRRTITITSSDCDRFQRLRHSALFSILQEVSIRDVELGGLTRDKTLDKGFLWVISRMKITMERPILYGETVTVFTSPGDRMHMVFPRFYRIEDEHGEGILRGSALWTLIHADSRMPISPEAEHIEIPGIAEEDRIEVPMGLKPVLSDQPASIRTALFSDIDLNGHVNNTRYLDWMDDLFDVHFHEVYAVKTIQINYEHEVEYGTSVSLFYEYSDQIYRIDGKTPSRDAFHARLEVTRINA